MRTVEIRIHPNNFAKGVAFAKRYGGKYNGSTKTWSIPASRHELNAPSAYGWILVKPATDPAATYAGQASLDAADSTF